MSGANCNYMVTVSLFVIPRLTTPSCTLNMLYAYSMNSFIDLFTKLSHDVYSQ